MNIHPLVVHFPVALLSVYSVLEVLRFPVITKQAWYVPAKTLLLLLGTIGGIVALQTGEIAEEAFRGTSTMALVELHSTFADACMIVYEILSASAVIRLMRTAGWEAGIPHALRGAWSVASKIEQAVFVTPVLVLGAIAGFALLGIVGALGGALVYGPEADPIVSLVYYLFYQ